jgi:hypothetical protein
VDDASGHITSACDRVVNAFTASCACIRLLMEWPTIRPEKASLTEHRYSLPSR